jgi:hypothetical protein
MDDALANVQQQSAGEKVNPALGRNRIPTLCVRCSVGNAREKATERAFAFSNQLVGFHSGEVADLLLDIDRDFFGCGFLEGFWSRRVGETPRLTIQPFRRRINLAPLPSAY